MTDIQRWVATISVPYNDGDALIGNETVVVTEADHVKAVNKAFDTYHQKYLDALAELSYLTERMEYLERNALNAAVQRVEALRISPQDWDYTSRQSYGDIRHQAWQEAIAAIKGGSDD